MTTFCKIIGACFVFPAAAMALTACGQATHSSGTSSGYSTPVAIPDNVRDEASRDNYTLERVYYEAAVDVIKERTKQISDIRGIYSGTGSAPAGEVIAQFSGADLAAPASLHFRGVGVLVRGKSVSENKGAGPAATESPPAVGKDRAVSDDRTLPVAGAVGTKNGTEEEVLNFQVKKRPEPENPQPTARKINKDFDYAHIRDDFSGIEDMPGLKLDGDTKR